MIILRKVFKWKGPCFRVFFLDNNRGFPTPAVGEGLLLRRVADVDRDFVGEGLLGRACLSLYFCMTTVRNKSAEGPLLRVADVDRDFVGEGLSVLGCSRIIGGGGGGGSVETAPTFFLFGLFPFFFPFRSAGNFLSSSRLAARSSLCVFWFVDGVFIALAIMSWSIVELLLFNTHAQKKTNVHHDLLANYGLKSPVGNCCVHVFHTHSVVIAGPWGKGVQQGAALLNGEQAPHPMYL